MANDPAMDIGLAPELLGQAGNRLGDVREMLRTWDPLDKRVLMGATACIVIPWFMRRYEEGTPWQAMAWWIHDHRDRLPYSEMCCYPVYAAFNIRWYAGDPEHKIKSRMQPRLLTKPGCENHLKDHSPGYPGFPELILP